jgi:hypothetical protein
VAVPRSQRLERSSVLVRRHPSLSLLCHHTFVEALTQVQSSNAVTLLYGPALFSGSECQDWRPCRGHLRKQELLPHVWPGTYPNDHCHCRRCWTSNRSWPLLPWPPRETTKSVSSKASATLAACADQRSRFSRDLVHLHKRTDSMTSGILEEVSFPTLLPNPACCRFASLPGLPMAVHADYDSENTTYNGHGSDYTARSAPGLQGQGDAAGDIRRSLPRRSQSTTALRRPPRLHKTGSRIPLPSRSSAFGHRPRIDQYTFLPFGQTTPQDPVRAAKKTTLEPARQKLLCSLNKAPWSKIGLGAPPKILSGRVHQSTNAGIH